MPDASLGGRDTHPSIRTLLYEAKVGLAEGYPGDARRKIDDALAQLDAAEVCHPDGRHYPACRLVPDPVVGSPGARHNDSDA